LREKKNEKVELSLRCTRQFNELAGVHLGTDIAAPLGEFLHGVGGGHAMASGVSGEGEIQAALQTMPRTSKAENSQNCVATLK